jgi:hypothetical protein
MAGVCVFHLLTQELSATANLQGSRLLQVVDKTAIEIIPARVIVCCVEVTGVPMPATIVLMDNEEHG